ncbi:unnamed protein product [Urochloa humidicola]
MAASGGGGADHISSLPDHLLHTILLHLRDTAAAARTSALSRRWRRVWTTLPELSLRFRYDPTHAYWEMERHRERMDAALAAHAAPVVTLLDVALPRWVPTALQGPKDPDDRDDPLLRFLASHRVAGEIRLTLRDGWYDFVLPPCDDGHGHLPLLRGAHAAVPAAAADAFAALGSLRIKKARVDARELGEGPVLLLPALEGALPEADHPEGPRQ